MPATALADQPRPARLPLQSTRPRCRPIPGFGHVPALPGTAPAGAPPTCRPTTAPLRPMPLRLCPVDPLGRKAEDQLTRTGWRIHPLATPLPQPHPWAHTMVRVIIEVLEGYRPCEQLGRWLATDIMVAMRKRTELTATRRPPAPRLRTRSVRIQTGRVTADHVSFECIGIVDTGNRSRAVAFRAESYASRWKTTALEVG
ncbi:MAG: Rv3235 family protein [Actinomycetaceae bacterium]|nr:Rv3235 family protein [Actinomycetaceae bacterium]